MNLNETLYERKKNNKNFSTYIKNSEKEIKENLFSTSILCSVLIDFKERLKDKREETAQHNVQKYKALEELYNDKRFKEDLKLEESTKEVFKKAQDVNFWYDYIDAQLNICVSIIIKLTNAVKEDNNVLINDEKYNDLIDYLTGTDTTEETQEKIIKNYYMFFSVLIELFIFFALYRLETIKKYKTEKVSTLLSLFLDLSDITEENEKDIVNKINELSDKELGEIFALYGIKEKIDGLLIKYDDRDHTEDYKKLFREDLDENTKELSKSELLKTSVKYETIPLFRFEHNDVMTIADTELIDILTDGKITYDIKTYKDSENTISNLEQIDRDILDFIVLDVYANNTPPVFTDRDIAIHFEKPNSSYTITQYTLQQIRDSLIRLQNIRISEGLIAKSSSTETKAFIKKQNPLIWLKTIRIEKEKKNGTIETTTHYEIVGEPPYYQYAYSIGKIQEYERKILIRDIEGIDNSLLNQALKSFLIRQILKLEQFDYVEIDSKKIYDVLQVKDSRKYADCRNKALKMLEDLRQDYNISFAIKGNNDRAIKKKILKIYRTNKKQPLKVES